MKNSSYGSSQVGALESSEKSVLASGVQDIPDKLYFKIGEVSAITGIEPHVLRYWESEIKKIKPQRASSKQRLYRREDIATILKVKQLVQIDRFTLVGARKYLAAQKKIIKKRKESPLVKPDLPNSKLQDFCKEIKENLEEIKRMLEV